MQPLHLINLSHHKNRLSDFKKNNSFLLNHTHVFKTYDGASLYHRQLILKHYITEKTIIMPIPLALYDPTLNYRKLLPTINNEILITGSETATKKHFFINKITKNNIIHKRIF